MAGKESELVCEVEQYHLDVVGLISNCSLEPNSWEGAGLYHILKLPWGKGNSWVFVDSYPPKCLFPWAFVLEFSLVSKRVVSCRTEGSDCGMCLCTNQQY